MFLLFSKAADVLCFTLCWSSSRVSAGACGWYTMPHLRAALCSQQNVCQPDLVSEGVAVRHGDKFTCFSTMLAPQSTGMGGKGALTQFCDRLLNLFSSWLASSCHRSLPLTNVMTCFLYSRAEALSFTNIFMLCYLREWKLGEVENLPFY